MHTTDTKQGEQPKRLAYTYPRIQNESIHKYLHPRLYGSILSVLRTWRECICLMHRFPRPELLMMWSCGTNRQLMLITKSTHHRKTIAWAKNSEQKKILLLWSTAYEVLGCGCTLWETFWAGSKESLQCNALNHKKMCLDRTVQIENL